MKFRSSGYQQAVFDLLKLLRPVLIAYLAVMGEVGFSGGTHAPLLLRGLLVLLAGLTGYLLAGGELHVPSPHLPRRIAQHR